jgi:hypothetical protein
MGALQSDARDESYQPFVLTDDTEASTMAGNSAYDPEAR